VSAEIKDATDLEAKLLAGGGGVFDVRCDGELVFSKFREGRFPATGEILQLI